MDPIQHFRINPEWVIEHIRQAAADMRSMSEWLQRGGEIPEKDLLLAVWKEEARIVSEIADGMLLSLNDRITAGVFPTRRERAAAEREDFQARRTDIYPTIEAVGSVLPDSQ